ncbi:MAG TPA: putative selenate reductase subunit YgfK [Sediminispirochaeta sp.]|nr:putative selenate reductase subunit YgfK [Sediminispirochaeta sp.]
MGDTMRPIPFKEMFKRIFWEYSAKRTIFGIPEIHFFKKQNKKRVHVFNDWCDTPMGPAAGPHTQMTQNIVAAYLTGGRFMELKTVQRLDSLEIDKPCIDARDEGYNTEWSTEYSLEKAFDDYVKAWFILHVLEALFETRVDPTERSFLFNMSVGYDLEGIKTEKMDYFIKSMIDASDHPKFKQYRAELKELIRQEGASWGNGLGEKFHALGDDFVDRISPRISPSVTLSTMHGCPPDEQEAICSYLLSEKKIDTYLKLNPTLLGYDRVREILDGLGYSYLHLSREAFGHDLKYADAVPMLERLRELASQEGLTFGVKLSNTLGSINDQGQLPGDDMYMSGRALYPLTINLAAQLSEHFDGELPISYAGGASAMNVEALFAAGIRPITVATDLLKPGGYMRLKEMSLKTEVAPGWKAQKVDVKAVRALARQALEANFTKKSYRGSDKIFVDRPLPIFDCYIAPCTVACPIGQDVPEYIRLAGQGRYDEALDVIYERNALPNITGYICDHQCQYNCTRLDYEGAVQIREMKRIAAENGWDRYIATHGPSEKKREGRVAVIGAGPAGLSAAYFLAREGFEVTVFEKHQDAGGVVRHVIPHFRLPVEAIEKDVDFIKAHGVKFEFGADPKLTRDDLRNQGFTYIFLGVGAEKDNPLRIEGGTDRVIRSLEFLWDYRNTPEKLDLSGHVVVVGGGNTAMDSARAATKLSGVKKVTVLYRRAFAQMPADMEEYENAVDDGVEFRFLRNPESISEKGAMKVRVMELGEPDSSGRPRPVATEKVEEMKVDHLITAIGEKVDTEALAAFGVPLGDDGWPQVDPETLETAAENVFLGGDAESGPSTVVRCIAAGRKAADAITKREDPHWQRYNRVPRFKSEEIRREVLPRKGAIIQTKSVRSTGSDELFAQREAQRCLQCSYICNKCVEVCPNRANVVISVPVEAGFGQDEQIVHIDALCNECGNCATFCPWNGKPYKDKFTVFNLREDFDNSENDGFLIEGESAVVRLNGAVRSLPLNEEGSIESDELDSRVSAMIETIVHKHAYLLGEVDR